jgi:hypothetical protein
MAMWQQLTLSDLGGIAGSLMICAAYLAVSVGRLDPEGYRYQGANAAGSALLLVSLWFRPNPGAIVIEVLWLTIALFAIGRIWVRRR